MKQKNKILRYRVIDKNRGIGSCHAEDITQEYINEIVQFGKMKDMILFYHHDSDMLILNEDSRHYEDIMRFIIQILSEEGQQKGALDDKYSLNALYQCAKKILDHKYDGCVFFYKQKGHDILVAVHNIY